MKNIFMMFIILALLFSSGFARAESGASPVEISAAKSLEWNRKDKTYTAREKVVVIQGAARIHSDMLIARYTDDQGMTEISTLEAGGNVIIQSPPYTAYGDHAVYNVKTGNAVMTGKAMKVATEADVVTAQDKIEFFSAEGRLVATGKATAIHGTSALMADVLGAYFGASAGGKMEIRKITATGNAVIETARETITGDAGVYDIPTQKAVLTGKVMIRQGKNWLEGTSANVDMATGISQLLGGGNADTEGRVRGVFYPDAVQQKNGEPLEIGP